MSNERLSLLEKVQRERWIKGHLGRFWDHESFKLLPYTKQSVTKEEVDDWVKKGYDQVKSYTGSMYDNRNPMPEWVQNFNSVFPEFKDMTYTIYKMETLEIMPEHIDHFNTYMKLFDVPYENCYRILVMLEDWKPGHYLEIDGNGFTNWIAGDYFIWKSDVPHAASNIGTQPRYTLQISCNPVDKESVWYNLHYYNFPDLKTQYVSTQWSMAKVLSVIDEEIKNKPMMVYMYNSRIKDLDKIEHKPNVIKHINEVGVNIYLVEPLCSYIKDAPQLFPPWGTRHDMIFYSEFKGDEKPEDFRAEELDTIKDYVERHKLTNVTVHTCDYDVDKWYPYYADSFKMNYDDVFVKSLEKKKISTPVVGPTFTKKFLTLNWRYTTHRHMIAAYVYLKDSYVSWFFRGDLSVVGVSKWFNIFDFQEKDSNKFSNLLRGIDSLNKNVPICLDVKVNTPITIIDKYFMKHFPEGTIANFTKGNYENDTIEQIYKDIFVDVVTESRFAQPTANYSEKVFHPMWYKKPFILAAPPFTLKALREQGFKTFSEFWDESYDELTNPVDRLCAIFDLIDEIDKKSIDELREIYKKMKDVVEHNYNILNSTLLTLI